MTRLRRALAALVTATICAVTAAVTGPPAYGGPAPTSHAPVVLFPAFHFTKLLVTVRDQDAAPGCPRSGSFQDWFQNPTRSAFSQVCRDELMTLRYNANPNLPWAKRFSEQRGVTVRILDYGSVASAPFYDPLFHTLEAAGWTADRDLRVAGYDSRLTPDQGGFLGRTVHLIEQTYRQNGNHRVFLVGHSNGPLYAQYLLTHTSHAWRAKYIAGFTPLAGNFPGQGSLYSIAFTGLNITDFSYPSTHANAVSSARMYLSAPSTYMSAGDPRIFGRREVVVRDASTGRSYTPADYPQLFRDAGLPQAGKLAKHYVGFVKFADRSHFPDVNVWAERGSGLATIVGAVLPTLVPGQLTTPSTQFFTRDGDSNQEDTTNVAIRVWRGMRGFHFSLTDNPGVGHFDLPSDPSVLARLVGHASATT